MEKKNFNLPTAEEENSQAEKQTLQGMSQEAKQAYYKELVAQVLARYNAERFQARHGIDDSNYTVYLPVRCESKKSAPILLPAKGEEESSPSRARMPPGKKDLIQSTTDNDVLCGRRSAHRNNPGNMRLRELCSSLYSQYKESNRAEKISLTWRIVRTLQSEGGRFLKSKAPSSEVWQEVSNDTALEKVALTIRDLNHLSIADSA